MQIKEFVCHTFFGVWQNFKTQQTKCLAIQHLIWKSMTTNTDKEQLMVNTCVVKFYLYLFSILSDKNYEI